MYKLLLVGRVDIPDNMTMTGNEFIRKVRRLGRKNGMQVTFVPRRGKGSHGTLFYGSRFTVVRNPGTNSRPARYTLCWINSV